jgi:hypothetical protein
MSRRSRGEQPAAQVQPPEPAAADELSLDPPAVPVAELRGQAGHLSRYQFLYGKFVVFLNVLVVFKSVILFRYWERNPLPDDSNDGINPSDFFAPILCGEDFAILTSPTIAICLCKTWQMLLYHLHPAVFIGV